ncbi:hypothetical protein [Amycolatopsis sp. NPDC051128]|uniref:hypothetical protein n=1 Tax=Amycolatopsis sp. NPDC051128 TaxID=3155412 RepID=UPI00341ABBA0
MRELAVALVELIAGAPAPQPDGDRTIRPSAAARVGAGHVVRALETASASLPPSG